ncbi:hypothetical protein [Methylomicrobium sp. Wu6]|uniref:hypothetical protein n=1 Tax=Methylomicrobium sp. Wu6 TaxID=3107928 RepID=UPI002DD660B0|nr:hypothetical protein [Methylomicrobium sp. Wu6]MEC4749034.1 hypothetical protein [Methylomicrobium sp. Wu6]
MLIADDIEEDNQQRRGVDEPGQRIANAVVKQRGDQSAGAQQTRYCRTGPNLPPGQRFLAIKNNPLPNAPILSASSRAQRILSGRPAVIAEVEGLEERESADIARQSGM